MNGPNFKVLGFEFGGYDLMEGKNYSIFCGKCMKSKLEYFH